LKALQSLQEKPSLPLKQRHLPRFHAPTLLIYYISVLAWTESDHLCLGWITNAELGTLVYADYWLKTYAAYTLSGFDNQERNLTFVKSFKTQNSCLQYEARFLSSSQAKYCASLTTRKYFLQAFRSVPGCQNCMCKRGIRV